MLTSHLANSSSKSRKKKNQPKKFKSVKSSTVIVRTESCLEQKEEQAEQTRELNEMDTLFLHEDILILSTLTPSSTCSNLNLEASSTDLVAPRQKSRACRKMDRFKSRILELEALIQSRDTSVPELQHDLHELAHQVKLLKSTVLELISEQPSVDESCQEKESSDKLNVSTGGSSTDVSPPTRQMCEEMKTDIEEIKSILQTKIHHGLVGELLRKRVGALTPDSFESMSNVELLQHVASHWDQMLQKLSSERDYQEEEKNILAQAYVDLEQQVDSLKKHISELESVIQQHEVAVFEKERLISDLNEDLDEQQKHLDSANDDVLAAAKLVAEMETKLNDKKQEIEALKEALVKKDKRIQTETSLLEKEQAALKNQVTELRRGSDRQVTLEQLLNKTVQQHALLQRENASLTMRLEQANHIITTQQASLQKAESTMFELRQQMMRQDQVILSAQSSTRAHDIDMKRLEMDYKQLSLSFESKQEYIQRLEKALMHKVQHPLSFKQDVFELLNPDWVPDESTCVCEFADCQEKFGLLKRRHHCRKCGHIFCFEHAKYFTKLNIADRTFDDEGVSARVCLDCYKNAELYHCPMDE